MTDDFKTAREHTLARFASHAAAMFGSQPARQSVLLAVSQYWDDNANDEVHGWVIASARMTPVWPHECDYNGERSEPVLAGEECTTCGERGTRMSFYGAYEDAMVGAFEQFCRESAHQSMDWSESYVPFAIARRVGDGVEVEVVGHAQRPPTQIIESANGGAEWPDTRARALFDEVCRNAPDDGPRAVLADYLLEQHPDDPRGEAIALALARELDADSRARRDVLFAEHGERWMFPLGDVIVAGTAHFERGFLARANVYAATDGDRDRVLGEPAWGTVHTIRFAPESRDVIAPTMRALRDVGPLRDEGLVAIARSALPWAIETLRVAYGDERALLRAKTLPRLVELEISTAFREAIVDGLARAPWRDSLQRLRFVGDYGSLADWRALRHLLRVPELSIAPAPYWSNIAASWELAFRADDSVVVRGAEWHGDATMLKLAELLGELPADTRIGLASSRTRILTDADAAWLRDYTGRDIGCLPGVGVLA